MTIYKPDYENVGMFNLCVITRGDCFHNAWYPWQQFIDISWKYTLMLALA